MLSERLDQLLKHIQNICDRCHRNPADITLCAVTKYATLDQINQAYTLGLRHFAESRIPSALEKMAQLPSDISWHFIGHLQSNKVSKALNFSLIHSVDTLGLAQKIASHSIQHQKTTQILLQVNTSNEATKQGFTVEACRQLYPELAQLPGIAIQGLMTMAPLTQEHKQIRNCFSSLRCLGDELKLNILSMGMSQDYPLAIEEGATHLRIGSLLFN